LRIFPKSDSSKKVADILINHIEKSSIVFQKEKVSSVKKENDSFIIATEASDYKFDYVILATGGKGNGADIAKALGHKIEPLRPSLTPLRITEKEFYSLSGLTLKDIWADVYFKNSKLFTTYGDLLFAHKSITGPLVFKISSLAAYTDFNVSEPLVLKLNISNLTEDELVQFIENNIKLHHHKTITNTFSQLVIRIS
jgi:predicted flavoprotein YhiN